MSLSTFDISELRAARHLTIYQESGGPAAMLVTNRGILAELLKLASQPIPFIRSSDEPTGHTLFAESLPRPVGQPPSGDVAELLHLKVRRVNTLTSWTLFTLRLREGDDISSHWEPEGRAVRLHLVRNGEPIHQIRLGRRRDVRSLPRSRRSRCAVSSADPVVPS